MIYDDLAYAVTHCHLSPREFARLTPAEWGAIAESAHVREQHEEQRSWEQTRTLLYAIVSPYLSHRISPRELLPFPWDEAAAPPQKETITDNDLRAIEARYC